MNRFHAVFLCGLLGLTMSGTAAAQAKEQPKAVTTPAAVRAAGPAQAVTGTEEAEVKRLMQERYPGLEVTSVTRTPFSGLYEIYAGEQIVYSDAKLSWMIIGTLVDPVTKSNLTDERLQILKAINVGDLPIDQAIKIVRGKGERKLVVFSDADCPFCKQLETTMAGMDNYTAYVLLYPIDQLHPDAARKSRMIWCAADRPKAWLDYMLKGVLPPNDGSCETPLPQLKEVAQKYRVVATPTMVFMDGRVVAGALPKDRLDKEFVRAEAQAAKTAKN